MDFFVVFFILLPIVTSILAYIYWKENKKIKKEYEAFEKIKDSVDIDSIEEFGEILKNGEDKGLDAIRKRLALYSNELRYIDVGLYEPQFDFSDPETYKQKIKEIRDEQKEFIRNGEAIICKQEWVVDGKASKGKSLTNKIMKLALRAFNGESDSLVSKIKWNNIQRSKDRIVKVYETINKMTKDMHIYITPEYLDLKLQEAQLVYEHKEKQRQIKEEQAEIRAQIREEAKLQKEIEKTKKEEEKYQKMLEKAKKEAMIATGQDLEELNKKIELLNNELEKSKEANQRAKSMAEQTKAGHIYIISNIGSFGKNIYKIGMTRRLEPTERVKELGDASVPFAFDIHAIIYTENAPEMEHKLHRIFNTKRVNLSNNRKEFFNVTLDEIKQEVLKIKPDAEFIETIEAREYRETIAQKKLQGNNKEAIEVDL